MTALSLPPLGRFESSPTNEDLDFFEIKWLLIWIKLFLFKVLKFWLICDPPIDQIFCGCNLCNLVIQWVFFGGGRGGAFHIQWVYFMFFLQKKLPKVALHKYEQFFDQILNSNPKSENTKLCGLRSRLFNFLQNKTFHTIFGNWTLKA